MGLPHAGATALVDSVMHPEEAAIGRFCRCLNVTYEKHVMHMTACLNSAGIKYCSYLCGRSLVADIILVPLDPDRCSRTTGGDEGADLAEGPETGGWILLADLHAVGFL